MHREEPPPEEQDWHRFRQLNQLHNHWQRPGWAEWRRSYHWFLTFEDAEGLRALAGHCQEALRDLSHFDLVPLDLLHLTLHRLAFTDELPVSHLPAVVSAVRQRCRNLAPLRLRIGWLAASAGAIRFTALPVAPLRELRDAVVTQTTNDEFWPHISIAYSNSEQPAAPIRRQIEPLRSLPPAVVLVTSVALVELRQERRVYRWKELERIGTGKQD